jgi:hypothetical protein
MKTALLAVAFIAVTLPALALPTAHNYTPVPKIERIGCTTTCTVENCGRNWDDGQGRCRQVCRQHCY